MTRQRVSLEPPPDEISRLRDFPRSMLDPQTRLWRVTRKSHGPWWFSGAMTGRFDLAEPEGTCYLATDPFSAVLEVIGPDRSGGMITTDEIAHRILHELRIPQPCRAADLTSRQAAGFGITLEINSHPDYELTQAWARRLRDASAEGLLYLARHDPAAGCSVALFGDSGEQQDWDQGQRQGLDDPELIDRLWSECQIRVVDRPRLDELQVID